MIYLDNNATTPIDPLVVKAMSLDFDGIPRNPSSVTKFGREGRAMITQARAIIADYFGVGPDEIIFTSGATESNHLLLQGFQAKYKLPIITTKIEHKSVLDPIEHLSANKTYIEINESGSPSPLLIEKALQNTRGIIFLSAVNSETGALLDIDAIADLAKFYDVPLLLDSVAMLGKAKMNPIPEGVAGMSLSGHKVHGPKGIGIAIKRKHYKIPPLLLGGHQERGMRAGTENLPGILGFAKAIELINDSDFNKIHTLRSSFEETLLSAGLAIEKNITGNRICNVSNLYFPNQDAETLLIQLESQGIIASLGSACSSGTLEPSHVLLNIYSNSRASSSLRFSLSRLNTKEEIDLATKKIISLLSLKNTTKEAVLSSRST